MSAQTKLFSTAAILCAVLWLGCQSSGSGSGSSTGPGTGERKYLLEQVDDTAVAQLYADGFTELSTRDKILCYYLSQAAIAGRDIFLDQKFEHNLAIRALLEELYLKRELMSPSTAAEIERYTKLFWLHNGIHNAISTRKEILDLDRGEFDQAVTVARRAGARIYNDGARLFQIMTDPSSYRSVTNKSPGAGKDPLQESCNNLYVGVTSADLEGFTEKNPLNSRLVKTASGALEEQIYRAGDGAGIPPGRHARQISAIIDNLAKAIPYAPEPTARSLRLLIRYYQTGSVADWRAYNIAWVEDTDSVVDGINGFIEVYMDARGQKGSWEAIVSFINLNKTAGIKALAEETQWFEDRMPWDAEFKKDKVVGIAARAISVITETGDSGPISPIGINLPNESDIRQNHGSKSVNLSNVVEGYALARVGSSAGEFSWSPEEAARATRWSALSADTHTNLHEVVGHASGVVRAEVGNPADRLGTFYSTLEEGRADLIALYWIADPKMQEMGILPDPEAALAEYESYARNALVQLRRVELGGQIEEDHMRNRQMVIHWLIAKTDAIAVEERDGKTYYRVTSVAAFRQGCGTLLAEVMRIKATGDFAAGRDLVENYGTKVDPTLHREVLERIASLHLPSATGFVQPELRPVRDAVGEIIDVEVHYPQDLAVQMLGWSGRGGSSRER